MTTVLIDLPRLRKLHRNREFDLVLGELEPRGESCTLPEKVLLALALVMYGRDDGQSLLLEAAAQEPDCDDPLWQSDVALACLFSGHPEKALELLRQAVVHPAATAVEFGRLAGVCLHFGDLDQARENYEQAVHRSRGRGYGTATLPVFWYASRSLNRHLKTMILPSGFVRIWNRPKTGVCL